MTAEELKAFCKEQNLTYKELAEKIGYGEGAIKTAVSTNNISQPMQHAINMFSKISQLENELKKANEAKEILKTWLNS
ncbi:MAG: helix-turn-helix transcriptional regulator [Campylobacter lanienae]|uniref:helix-turn-helix domain-containing protein n=1 Tax=Campylobacter devanensis TaxID=3161138 RepID=UPI000A335E27|nr:helix-turn-helix transcriptional regulator [Campylobacter sp. P0187]MDY6056698.1 helix-turn-helix transcriptional regulator [Campylobacter lanienae]